MSEQIEDIVKFFYMMSGGLIVGGIAAAINYLYLEGKKLKREVNKEKQEMLHQRAHHMNIYFEDKCLFFEEGLLNNRDFKYELSRCLKYYFDFLNQENQRKARIYTIKLGDFP